MNHELERIWKETVVALSGHYPEILPRVTEGNHEKFQSGLGDVLTEIQTEHLLNTSLELYRYVNPLSVFSRYFIPMGTKYI
jgi:hypothetical protein